MAQSCSCQSRQGLCLPAPCLLTPSRAWGLRVRGRPPGMPSPAICPRYHAAELLSGWVGQQMLGGHGVRPERGRHPREQQLELGAPQGFVLGDGKHPLSYTNPRGKCSAHSPPLRCRAPDGATRAGHSPMDGRIPPALRAVTPRNRPSPPAGEGGHSPGFIWFLMGFLGGTWNGMMWPWLGWRSSRCQVPLAWCWWSSHPAAMGGPGTSHSHGTPMATIVPRAGGGVVGSGCIRAMRPGGRQAAWPRTSTLMRKTMRKKTHMKKRSITLATFFHSPVRRWAARWRRKQPAM